MERQVHSLAVGVDDDTSNLSLEPVLSCPQVQVVVAAFNEISLQSQVLEGGFQLASEKNNS